MADSRYAPGVQGSFFLVVNSYRNRQKPLPFADEGFLQYTETFYTYLSFNSQYRIVFDCTKKGFFENLNNFLQEMEQYQVRVKNFYVAFIFLGHGKGEDLIMNDGEGVNICNVIAEFVRRVPEEFTKLFILDACRSDFRVSSLHDNQNCIFIYSTLPNDAAWRGPPNSPGRYGIWSYCFNESLRTNTGNLDIVRSSTDVLVRKELQLRDQTRSTAQFGQMIINGVPSPNLYNENRPAFTEEMESYLSRVTTDMKMYRGIPWP